MTILHGEALRFPLTKNIVQQVTVPVAGTRTSPDERLRWDFALAALQ